MTFFPHTLSSKMLFFPRCGENFPVFPPFLPYIRVFLNKSSYFFPNPPINNHITPFPPPPVGVKMKNIPPVSTLKQKRLVSLQRKRERKTTEDSIKRTQGFLFYRNLFPFLVVVVVYQCSISNVMSLEILKHFSLWFTLCKIVKTHPLLRGTYQIITSNP